MSNEEPPGERPTFDREAARARYRKMMRGPFMRGVGIFTVVVILLSWAWGAAAAFAPNVEHLPNHDYSVRPARCIACHTQPANAPRPAGVALPPRMPHWSAPSCGFCHRQSLPPK
ncbi:MAG: hypothetical protein H0X37_10250 [Herpetosiphonaceae bacterium]|nr:hypothetical protein [Herpetosiphonaceae bacterium]